MTHHLHWVSADEEVALSLGCYDSEEQALRAAPECIHALVMHCASEESRAYIENGTWRVCSTVLLHSQDREYESCLARMDDTVRARLRRAMPDATPQQFVDAYVEEHRARFRTRFEVP